MSFCSPCLNTTGSGNVEIVNSGGGISTQLVRMRGQYLYHYLEMIENIFGKVVDAAFCPTGWVATGDGFAGSGDPGVFVYASQPGGGDTPNRWFVAAFDTNPGPNTESLSAR